VLILCPQSCSMVSNGVVVSITDVPDMDFTIHPEPDSGQIVKSVIWPELELQDTGY